MAHFSIVIPAHNSEDTLAMTLDAVVAQNRDDWECVIIDDGSNDGTKALASEYERRDTRFRVLSQENRGTGGAYNTGVGAASGEWVCICSADDVLLPEYLASMSRAIEEHPAHDIYSCNGYYWNPDGSRELVYADDRATCPRSWTLEETFQRCFFSVGACYRLTIFETVDGYLEGAYGEDYDFWLRAMAGGARHWYVPEALALHRKSATQKTANLDRVYRSDIRSIASVLESGLLDREQSHAAAAAIRQRRILLLELNPVMALLIRVLRKARSIVVSPRSAR